MDKAQRERKVSICWLSTLVLGKDVATATGKEGAQFSVFSIAVPEAPSLSLCHRGTFRTIAAAVVLTCM